MKFKQIFRMTRYFLVSYYFILEDGSIGHGSATTENKKGTYVSVDDIREYVEESAPGIKKLIIQNIIELNKMDYKSWTKYNTKNIKE